jgi:protein-S-isoprenylcysteine O-methyltransferase Ste14
MPLTNWLGIAGLLWWSAYEVLLRRRGDSETASWSGGPSDRGSTVLLLVAFLATLGLTQLLLASDVGHIPVSLRWIGVALQVAGLLLRAWSMRVLGRYYTRTVRTVSEQRLVTEGPYRVLRHPGYTGSLLVWTGYCLSVGNWLAGLVAAALLLGAYGWRIRTEEKTLVQAFGDQYRGYQRQTARLVPLVY